MSQLQEGKEETEESKVRTRRVNLTLTLFTAISGHTRTLGLGTLLSMTATDGDASTVPKTPKLVLSTSF